MHSGLDIALHSAKIIKPFQLVKKIGNKNIQNEHFKIVVHWFIIKLT